MPWKVKIPNNQAMAPMPIARIEQIEMEGPTLALPRDTAHKAAAERPYYQPHVLKELQALENISPSSGFALQIVDYDGQIHRFANQRMQIGPSKADPFADAEQIVSLDHGDFYQSLRIYVCENDEMVPAATRHAVVLKALEITGFLSHSTDKDQAA